MDDSQLSKIYMTIMLPILVVNLICMWRIYIKAGYPGWYSIIPVYSLLILFKIVNRPSWWILLFLIPIVNIIFAIWVINLLAKKFKKDEAFTLGLIFLPLIFYPILAHRETKFYSEENDLESYSEHNSLSVEYAKPEEKESNTLFIGMMIILVNSIVWLIFANFIDRWYEYTFIYTALGLVYPIAQTFFGLSFTGKNRIEGIVISGCALYVSIINQLIPLFREPFTYFQF